MLGSMSDKGIPDEILEHYEQEVDEDLRLRQGLGELEFLRTQEIIRRHLPPGSARILDVGGASGIHTEWLLEDGHSVHLVDPLPDHVEQATERLGKYDGFSAEVGDPGTLKAANRSYDAALLLGPLYHLTESADRVTAWSEARRVVTSHGLVFGVSITRYAPLFDGLIGGALFDPAFRALTEENLFTGQHRNPARDPGWFSTAYFQHPDELAEEVAGAGLRVIELVGVEGLAAWVPELAERWDDPEGKETILFSARAIESEPSLRGLSAHLMAVATPGHKHGA
jgi:hypothetical protein